MTFTVEEVFYIKPPVDRVILVGTIGEGTIVPGQRATVHTSTGAVDVVVEGIEGFKQGNLSSASKGEQVGLRLTGIKKGQPSRGDTVTAIGGA